MLTSNININHQLPLKSYGYHPRPRPSRFRFRSPTSTTTQPLRRLTSTLCLIGDVGFLFFLSLVAWLGFVNPPLPPSARRPTEHESDAIIPLTDGSTSYPSQLNPGNAMNSFLYAPNQLDDRELYDEAETMSTRHQWPPPSGIGVDASY